MLTEIGTSLRDAVVAAYLETGRDQTVAEIAVRTGMSEAKVRKHLTDHVGFPADGLQRREESRTSYSKSYPAMEAGAHKVTTYGPSREYLRGLLNAARRSA